jgi:hypothetical protein
MTRTCGGVDTPDGKELGTQRCSTYLLYSPVRYGAAISSPTETQTPSQQNNVLTVAGMHNAAISDPFELLTLEDVGARLKFTRRQCYELTRRRGSSLNHSASALLQGQRQHSHLAH